MCDECRQSPCAYRCPNSNPRYMCTCCECGEPIYFGEQFTEVNGRRMHAECASEMDGLEMLKRLGIELDTAEEDYDL